MTEYEFNFMVLCAFFTIIGFLLGYLTHAQYDSENCMKCKNRFKK
jgi:hypothetical protein